MTYNARSDWLMTVFISEDRDTACRPTANMDDIDYFVDISDDFFCELPDFTFNFGLENDNEEDHDNDDKNNPSKKARFAELTESDLNDIVSTSTAASTKYQTKWAIAIFEGKNMHNIIFYRT